MQNLQKFVAASLTDPAVFWVMASAIATAVLIVVAYKQLRDLARTSRSDFLYRLKSDFFNEPTRQLIFLTEHNLIEFREAEIPYFEIVGRDRPGVTDRLEELGIRGTTISAYLIDDVLLGPLEDVGILEELGLVSLEEAYEEFVTYCDICMENEAIRAYLKCSDANPDDDDVYDHLRRLHEKLQLRAPEIRRKKRNRKRPRWWK